MTRRTVLVRHGMPEVDSQVPSAEWRLSAQGRQDALALSERLRDFSFSRVLSSPEPKALDTANVIAEALHLPVKVDGAFAEHARRSVGFLPAIEFQQGISRLFSVPDELVFGSETADAAHERFAGAIGRQLSRDGEADGIVVSHGTVISLFISRMVACDPFVLWKEFEMSTAIVLTDGTFSRLTATSVNRRR